jgi:hypothetical protein
MNKTVVLVLRSGGDFHLCDVELITRHIKDKWMSGNPRIICLCDKISQHYDLGNYELIPLNNDYPGTWSRMMLYSPDMEKYRPFLYIDLDTAVINSLEKIFELVKDPCMFIPLEDFYQKGQLATGLAWIPANSEKINGVWEAWKRERGKGFRMDTFLRKNIVPDTFWQRLTNTIQDFKPRRSQLLQHIPDGTDLVCFHGKPRIHDAVYIGWVKDYVNYTSKPKVTVIIPYNKDRGWLKDAITSVPDGVQLILSQGQGNWPENFNKVLNQVKGDYVRWLHEDDMLTENCIEDSVNAIEEQGVDFIHGDATEISMNNGKSLYYVPSIKIPTEKDLINKNVIHSATLMYKREVFEKFKMDETLNTSEEYEFNLRLLHNGLKIGYCATTLAFYRRHPQQKVRVVSSIKKNKEHELIRDMYR